MARTTRKNNSDVSTMISDSSASMRSASTTQSSPSRQPARRQSASARNRLTQEQIAQRAKAIWQAKGCQVGQDLENWFEAETQLKSEMNASC
ncbi:MAG: DUF2934 domain-containing protein [Planctomycetaceae bacterium]|nr:DUF2934 domain-containing protein [Planctomycetaceae bacterium]